MASGRSSNLPLPIGKPPVIATVPSDSNQYASYASERGLAYASETSTQAWVRKHSKNKDAEGGPTLDVERCKTKEMDTLMGKAFRNPLTGEVFLQDYGTFPDFVIADLWTRKNISGQIGAMAHDPYILRVIPMQTRTWIYHHLFRGGRALSQSGVADDAMIRGVLAMPCIDANVSGGKWSSVMFYAPMLIIMCLCKDLTAVLGGIVTICATLALTFWMNNPEWYRRTRLATWPIRAIFFVWTIWRMGAAQNGTAINAFGFIFALIFTVLEMCLGDCGAVQAYRMHCSYDVVRKLPNRIFICTRQGAAHSQEIFGEHLPPDEKITGIASDAWQSDLALIADVRGLVVELKPVRPEDWTSAYQDKDRNGAILRYVGLDVFSPGTATIHALAAAIREQNEAAELKRQAMAAMHASPMDTVDEVQVVDA
mmetsp:Transcript_113735/g.178959  ORF Transcript_113735/g.178959 Transcript_113735/m.178959 type:complete len:425 (-) Transcript_113735:176-1450(-)|eukprot:CAMPEP_0169069378 /NCGR_PEP_ID=MMETSP1015-20121227/4538_1 /TAXON_ID=342587 /ORGANISM="Karlodinium micrum, Strain CCMP2283" /LENGTH=424 /DNA_ID=CAMNT_0009128281 /DNA_START=70 /DNA_END=1344 /DNA_ORIENTATION=+